MVVKAHSPSESCYCPNILRRAIDRENGYKE
jgi:hypothetical protein